MDLYTKTSYELSRRLTLNYSTSFGQSTKLFTKDIQNDIFAIYGVVRIADEIVDTYDGSNKANTLTQLEKEVFSAIQNKYSPNPIVHSFALTAARYGINEELITPFFESMRMDLRPMKYSQTTYEKYIYGSAEVIGLMCLKVFCGDDTVAYKRLSAEAKALGAAYQKVNFLRDFGSDYQDRQRIYFPDVTFESFDEATKALIIKDIQHDFKKAKPALVKLPESARKAVALSYSYYSKLLNALENTSAETIKTSRIRVSDFEKVKLFIQNSLKKNGTI